MLNFRFDELYLKINVAAAGKSVLVALVGYVVGFFVPIFPFIVVLTGLLIADLYTGTKAARHRKEVINADGYRRTAVKWSLYMVGILATHGVELVFLKDKLSGVLVYMTAFYFAYVELRSNLENIGEVTGADVWQNVKSFLPDVAKAFTVKRKDDERKD